MRAQDTGTLQEVAPGRARMSIETVFPSTAAMEQAMANGTDVGLSQAVSQIEAILAEETNPALGRDERRVTASTSHPRTNSGRKELAQ